MKLYKLLLLVVFTSFFSISTCDAQLFKKLKEKVEKKISKDDNETTEEADSTQKRGFSGLFGKMDKVPEQYEFSWKYQLQMQNRKSDSVDIIYWINPNEKYLGAEIPYQDASTFIVMDENIESTILFMNNEGQKMAMMTKLQQAITERAAEEMEQQEEYLNNLTKLENKTILGYNCEGYQFEDEEAIVKMWLTNDAAVSFSHVFAGNKQFKNYSDSEWIKAAQGALMMEMHYLSKKKKKDNFEMKCTELSEQKKTIHKAEYQSIM